MEFDAELIEFADASRDDLARLLMAASDRVNQRTLAALDPEGTSGVRVAHVPVIAALDSHGSRVADLAARIGHTRQSVAALVKDLERHGVVALEPDPTDRRATRVRLTAHGAAFCRRAAGAMRDSERRWRDEQGDDAIDTVRATLRSLAAEGD